ncbi:MAG: ParA family protein [Deltaproteobacteria bacterium]|nr:ParA family protein [Deltaproteobacteria bacterium]
MEERAGGFAFFCSQACLDRSHSEHPGAGAAAVACDACAKHFVVSLVSQVLYTGGRRRYACSPACRTQLVREARGVRLGEIAAQEGQGADGGQDGAASAPTGARAAPPEPAPRAPRRIAVFNHKGGTGKTTTAVNLAAGLAAAGHRVLLLDTDSQGNVGVSLGASAERSLYHVLVMGLRVADAVQKVRPGLDVLPSNETLAAAELYLAGRQQRDRVLAQRLSDAVDQYDYVVIDCSPSLSLMNQNALVLADSVLVPVACDYLSLVGVRQVLRTVRNVNTLLGHPIQIWGVLPTFYDARANICAEALQTLRQHFGPRCLRPIRATTKLKEAPAAARPIFEHAPGSHADEDYRALVERVLGDGQAERPATTAVALVAPPPAPATAMATAMAMATA